MKRLSLTVLIVFLGIGVLTLACGGSAPSTEPAATPAAEQPAQEAAAPMAATPPAGAEPAPGGESAAAEEPAEPGTETETEEAAAEPAPARPRLVAPVRGMAEIGYLKPRARREEGMIVTTFEIKNLATGAIAGLKVDEFWYDKQRNMVTGDSQRLRQPILPGEEITIELRVPINEEMDQSNYAFSHANGEIKATLLEEFR